MILSNDKMLFFTQCQRFKLFYSQHSFKAPLTQIGIYLNPHINFYRRFFLHEWSFRSHETNESADRETASF